MKLVQHYGRHLNISAKHSYERYKKSVNENVAIILDTKEA